MPSSRNGARHAPGANPATEPHPNKWYRSFNPDFKVTEKPIHDKKPLRLVIIGAGASGLLIAFKAARQLANVTFVVYEKNDDVGGTWYENRYPGLEVSGRRKAAYWKALQGQKKKPPSGVVRN
jgi:hypothetical protein